MKLTHVSFAHPIPIPSTHIRQADFAASDGWTLEDEDGRITLQKGELRFHTYVSASCVEAPFVMIPVTEDTPRAWNAPSPEEEQAMHASHAAAGRQNEQAMRGRKGKR